MSLFLTSFIFEKKEYDEEFYQLDGWIERYTQSIEAILGWKAIPMPPAEEWLIIITGRPANQWSY